MRDFFAPLIHVLSRIFVGACAVARHVVRRRATKRTPSLAEQMANMARFVGPVTAMERAQARAEIEMECNRALNIQYYMAGNPDAPNDPARHDEYAREGARLRQEHELTARLSGGLIFGLDTSAWRPGDPVYLDDDGTLTQAPPMRAPNAD